MAVPATITHNGALSGSPGSGSVLSIQEIANTSFTATYGGSKSARISVIGATDGAPYVVPFETLTKVRALLVRARGSTIKVRVTSAVGTDQSINVSELFLWHAPNSGDELTAIKFVGTADLEYFLAGDVG